VATTEDLRAFHPQATVILTAQEAPGNLQKTPAETPRVWLTIAAAGPLKRMLFSQQVATEKTLQQAPRGRTAARAYTTTLRELPWTMSSPDGCGCNRPETALPTGKLNRTSGDVLEGSQLINLNHLRTIGAIDRSSIRCCRNVRVVHPGRRISRSSGAAGSGLARRATTAIRRISATTAHQAAATGRRHNEQTHRKIEQTGHLRFSEMSPGTSNRRDEECAASQNFFWLTENAFLLTAKQKREETGERERRE
jgi:hypothetical protein